ncbi:hypothetical protein Emag_000313 [Eimeria magna]
MTRTPAAEEHVPQPLKQILSLHSRRTRPTTTAADADSSPSSRTKPSVTAANEASSIGRRIRPTITAAQDGTSTARGAGAPTEREGDRSSFSRRTRPTTAPAEGDSSTGSEMSLPSTEVSTAAVSSRRTRPTTSFRRAASSTASEGGGESSSAATERAPPRSRTTRPAVAEATDESSVERSTRSIAPKEAEVISGGEARFTGTAQARDASSFSEAEARGVSDYTARRIRRPTTATTTATAADTSAVSRRTRPTISAVSSTLPPAPLVSEGDSTVGSQALSSSALTNTLTGRSGGSDERIRHATDSASGTATATQPLFLSSREEALVTRRTRPNRNRDRAEAGSMGLARTTASEEAAGMQVTATTLTTPPVPSDLNETMSTRRRRRVPTTVSLDDDAPTSSKGASPASTAGASPSVGSSAASSRSGPSASSSEADPRDRENEGLSEEEGRRPQGEASLRRRDAPGRMPWVHTASAGESPSSRRAWGNPEQSADPSTTADAEEKDIKLATSISTSPEADLTPSRRARGPRAASRATPPPSREAADEEGESPTTQRGGSRLSRRTRPGPRLQADDAVLSPQNTAASISPSASSGPLLTRNTQLPGAAAPTWTTQLTTQAPATTWGHFTTSERRPLLSRADSERGALDDAGADEAAEDYLLDREADSSPDFLGTAKKWSASGEDSDPRDYEDEAADRDLEDTPRHKQPFHRKGVLLPEHYEEQQHLRRLWGEMEEVEFEDEDYEDEEPFYDSPGLTPRLLAASSEEPEDDAAEAGASSPGGRPAAGRRPPPKPRGGGSSSSPESSEKPEGDAAEVGARAPTDKPAAGRRPPPGPRGGGGSSPTTASTTAKPTTTTEEDPYEEYPDHCGDAATFVEGRQIVEWDIPIFNGIVHVLGSSVLRPDIEALATNIAFWHCTHQFCFECPFLTPFFLQFLDKDGIITSIKPFDFMPPPGVRPDWVCRGAFSYYPPGWTKKTWKKYLDNMHSTDKRVMKRNAELVARAAQGRREIAELYESVRLQSIEARRRYDALRPISDEKYDPNYKNMKKSFDDKRFDCKGEAVNREMFEKQMHKIIPAVYPWLGK